MGRSRARPIRRSLEPRQRRVDHFRIVSTAPRHTALPDPPMTQIAVRLPPISNPASILIAALHSLLTNPQPRLSRRRRAATSCTVSIKSAPPELRSLLSNQKLRSRVRAQKSRASKRSAFLRYSRRGLCRVRSGGFQQAKLG